MKTSAMVKVVFQLAPENYRIVEDEKVLLDRKISTWVFMEGSQWHYVEETEPKLYRGWKTECRLLGLQKMLFRHDISPALISAEDA